MGQSMSWLSNLSTLFFAKKEIRILILGLVCHPAPGSLLDALGSYAYVAVLRRIKGQFVTQRDAV